jgi:acyl phosphate:glycerol-3-phosphate acyltransferase
MNFLIDAAILLASYLIGSIPFGLVVVKLLSGKDIRNVASGRTGGTNAMRAAGPFAGVLTAILDILKAALTVWLARWLSGNVWIHALAPIAAISGNNYSIFLAEKNSQGRIHLRGGAGGAAAGGGAFGLWPPAGFILVPVCFLVWFGTGFASVTTLSIGFVTILIFTIRALSGAGPWAYVVYGVLAEVLMIWGLRPNIRRLLAGTERRHGLPVILQRRREEKKAAQEQVNKNKQQNDGPQRNDSARKGPKPGSRVTKTRRNEISL